MQYYKRLAIWHVQFVAVSTSRVTGAYCEVCTGVLHILFCTV